MMGNVGLLLSPAAKFKKYFNNIFIMKEEKTMPELFEIIMLISFGSSWPLNVIKSIKMRSTKGKSLPFLLLIIFGYICGITSKLINPVYMASFSEKWYVLFFYVLNLSMVTLDLCLYFRNASIEKKQQSEEK